jgi:peptidoglycan hydrolase-like protein with peptidoglycan-binding domain
MRKLIFSSLVVIALSAAVEPAQAGRRSTDDGFYFPTTATYDSHGQNRIVRNVQRALREDGYYVGDTMGNFCHETRVAVRRYRRDHGLPVVGKIDEEFLRTLGF